MLYLINILPFIILMWLFKRRNQIEEQVFNGPGFISAFYLIVYNNSYDIMCQPLAWHFKERLHIWHRLH